MADTMIVDSTSVLRVESGHGIKLINKSNIIDIELINDRICINMGKGTLQQFFIDYNDVSSPATGSIAELMTALENMMRSKEDLESTQLEGIWEEVGQIKMILNGTNDYFKEPLRIDDPGTGIVYKGYTSTLSADDTEPLWAVCQIKQSGAITQLRWADGSKEFNKAWAERALLNYLP